MVETDLLEYMQALKEYSEAKNAIDRMAADVKIQKLKTTNVKNIVEQFDRFELRAARQQEVLLGIVDFIVAKTNDPDCLNEYWEQNPEWWKLNKDV